MAHGENDDERAIGGADALSAWLVALVILIIAIGLSNIGALLPALGL